MEDDRRIIYEFLNQFEDFTQSDIESGYLNVYRPGWHPYPMQFWFNPPYGADGKSVPTLSNAIFLLENGSIMVEDVHSHLAYNLDECLGDSESNLVEAVRNHNHS